MKKKYLGKADKSYKDLHKGISRFDTEFDDKEIMPGIRDFDKSSVDSVKKFTKNNPLLKKKF